MQDFACLNEVEEIRERKQTKKDLNIKKNFYSDISQENIKYLKDLKYWDAIVQNRAGVLSN